jgi:signal transduction histidine kinase
LYRILQEALTNVARHSGAKAVSIGFARSATTLTVAVTDDGCGFDTKGVGVSSSRLGIQGMRERAAMLGGTISFTSKGRGTRLVVEIPLTGQHHVQPLVRRMKI